MNVPVTCPLSVYFAHAHIAPSVLCSLARTPLPTSFNSFIFFIHAFLICWQLYLPGIFIHLLPVQHTCTPFPRSHCMRTLFCGPACFKIHQPSHFPALSAPKILCVHQSSGAITLSKTAKSVMTSVFFSKERSHWQDINALWNLMRYKYSELVSQFWVDAWRNYHATTAHLIILGAGMCFYQMINAMIIIEW